MNCNIHTCHLPLVSTPPPPPISPSRSQSHREISVTLTGTSLFGVFLICFLISVKSESVVCASFYLHICIIHQNFPRHRLRMHENGAERRWTHNSGNCRSKETHVDFFIEKKIEEKPVGRVHLTWYYSVSLLSIFTRLPVLAQEDVLSSCLHAAQWVLPGCSCNGVVLGFWQRNSCV